MIRATIVLMLLAGCSAATAQSVQSIRCSPTTGVERFIPREQRCQPAQPAPVRPWRWAEPPPAPREPAPLELRSGRLNHRHYLPPPYDPMIDPAPGLENQWQP